ncbi:DNA polymerase iota [Episyrphus balteatus]|uniref:DNA polymerase iota n=1 Tax=Episyrphus balteatus TaxID=286459 RepID=UPI002485E030|nr:DNA polymerase iota [Episyrphus balteatus]
MDFESFTSQKEPHARTIIHFDMDCFYAQVEELRDVSLRTKPLGIQQKQIVVTCNYVARQYGVTKLMLISEAKKLCPNIVLVNGEDLTNYRQMSNKIFEIVHKYTPLVEKMGFDEDFADVTELVATRWKDNIDVEVEGYIHPVDHELTEHCDCGCDKRLAIGSQIAKEIRQELFVTLGITCCAGISYNKLLAKLVGSINKPNKQTVLISNYAEEFMREINNLHSITGIGQKTEALLLENGIANVTELQNSDIDMLKKKLGFETATKLKELSFGRDIGPVRPTGKPKTIGLEDACRPISVKKDVEEKFRMLLMRLIEQVSEDGRIPIAIKVVLRKFDSAKKTSHRETKQANILPSLFKSNSNGQITLAEGALGKLLKIIMRLFERVVDLEKPFNITLIGLAFSKFQQRKTGSSSIANYLIKKTDLEVQSVTSITSDEGFLSSPQTFRPSDQFYRRRTTASPIPMNVDLEAPSSDISDFSENEVEPSPKKSRFSLLIAKRRCLSSNDVNDIASPSKLRVCDLRLNSRDSEKDISMSPISSPSTSFPVPPPSKCSSPQNINYSPTSSVNGGDESRDIGDMVCDPIAAPKSQEPNTSIPQQPSQTNEDSLTTTAVSTQTTISGNLANIPCPSGVDQSVFNELPLDVQNELINTWRSSMAAKANNLNTNTTAATSNISTNTSMAGGQKNTLYRYFLRNK